MADLSTGTPVGVLGSGSLTARVTDTIRSLDHPVITGGVDAIQGSDVGLVITTDVPSLHAVVDAGVGVPMLPLAVDDPSGTLSDAADTVREALTRGWTTTTQPVLTVGTGHVSGTVVYDATIMTDEPARISEYGIRDKTRDTEVSVRADGVVIATPAGSTGYAHAAGGPPIATDAHAVAVVPVAAFAVDRRPWVTTPPVSVTVRRDEGTVSLYSDGTRIGPIDRGETVTVEWGPDTPIATPVPSDKKT